MREHEGLIGRCGKREDVSLRHVRPVESADAVPAEVCAECGVAPDELRRRRRDGTRRGLAALALMRRCGMTERAVAERLGMRSGSAVSYLIRRLKERARTDAAIARSVERVTQQRR